MAYGIVNRRRRWTEEEDRLVIEAEFDDDDLAIKIKRTKFAIQKRRSRLKETQERGRYEDMKQYMNHK